MHTVEIDYYRDCEMSNGHELRSHVKTVRMDIPDGTKDDDLPFLLTSRVGRHHGILRVRPVP